MDIANSELANAAYNGPLAAALHQSTGVQSVMDAWSGGTFDPVTDSLIVWGGGHTDYAGNEVYSFSLQTLQWTMLSQPSDPTGYDGSSGILPDGTPVSRHTYDGITYIPTLNQVFTAGGADWFNGWSDANSWLYNPSTGRWTQAATDQNGADSGRPATDNQDDIIVYNSANNLVYEISMGGPNDIGLQAYNPSSNTWQSVGNNGGLVDYHMTGAIDPIDNILVATGNGFLQAVNLSTGAVTTITSSGDQTAQNGNAPGMVWDSAANLFVAWNGGTTLYTLDPHTWQWTAYNGALDNSVVPTAANGNGTFGRFQYDAADNVFVVVNDVSQDVYVFRPPVDAASGPNSSAATVTAATGGTAPQLVQGFGHEMFVFQNTNQAGATIEHFDPTLDTINLTQLLKSANLGGADPTVSGAVTIDPSGADSSAIVLHHNGQNTTLVTLDHVLPSSVPHADIIWN